ncbi:MAG TPA: carboxypeptidase-like regulatory domain-containing protein [Candidatus Tripitaka californicus]|uniref:carboxypeptidase-like regulatory domain-containing protein n=2 Tax=Candidatus Tripitaka californicus TaxID=3367616 RepID=UPI004029F874
MAELALPNRTMPSSATTRLVAMMKALRNCLWFYRLAVPFWPTIILGITWAAPLALLEDSILLKGPGGDVKEIRAKVTELRPDHVTAIISKEEVTSASYSMEDKEGYLDKVSFGSVEIACKVMDMGESTMIVGIPREAIASVRVSFQKEPGKGTLQRAPTTDAPSHSSGSGQLKAEAALGSTSLQELKEELKRELREEMGAEKKQEEKIIIAATTGRVEGRIARGGNPLPGCKVKIVLMARRGSMFFKNFAAQADAPEFETETDRDGKYVFQDIPEGDYKLFWRPPGEDSWIRRMKMEPDVLVQAGKTCTPKAVDTGRATVN